MTEAKFRARQAFLIFQAALVDLEESFERLQPELDEHTPLEFQYELKALGPACRKFFKLANRDIFRAEMIQ